MNKKVLILIGVIALLALGLFALRSKGKNGSPQTGSGQETGVFGSIKDALNKNVSLACEFKDEQGKSTKSYIKNGAVRVSSVDESDAGEIIILKDKMYMWSAKTKQGFVYPIKEEDQQDKVGLTGQEVASSESYLDMIETYKDSCKVSVVDDSLFTAPANVTFQDMSKLLEDLQKQIPSIPSQN